MAKAAKYALTVLASPDLAVAKDKIKSLESAAVAQCAAVTELETKASAGAVLAGITLHRVKLTTPHGKWGSWIEKHLTKVNGWTRGTANVNASYYMRLATAFIEKTRADKSLLLAPAASGTALDLGKDASSKKLAASLEKFVGGLSLTELLIKHGIKGVGLKTDLAQDDDGDGDDELTPEQKAQQERDAAWLELWTPTQQIRTTLTDPNKAQLLDAQKVAQLKAEIVELNKLIDERLANATATKI